MSKVLVLAGLSTLFWSTAGGETHWVADGHTAPRIGIFLDFDSDPSASLVRAMKREVAAVLALTGVQFSWLTLKKDTASSTFDDLAVLRFRGNCRAERIGGADLIGEAGPTTLGETGLESGAVTAYSSVGCDEIKTCISGLLGGSCARDRETAFGRALGRVVAHELYHILGKTTEHTHRGLAKSLQTSFDLIRENYEFDRRALLRLRQTLQIKKTAPRSLIPGAVSLQSDSTGSE
jgi:hypothetical protein